MKNVLLIIDSLRPGGAQRQIVNLANGLSAAGYLVDLYIYFPGYNYYRNDLFRNVNVIIGSKRFKYSLSPILELRKQIKKIKYASVIAFLTIPSFFSELAHWRIQGSYLIVSERSTFLGKKITFKQRFLYQFHRLADILVVNSYHQSEEIIISFPWLSPKVITIYNGIDIVKFTPERKISLKTKNCAYRFIVLSTVVPLKNAVNLAKAFIILSKLSDIPITIDWAGEHSHTIESAAEVKKVNELLSGSCLNSKWNWLGISNGVNNLLTTYDALIHPSLLEGLPNSICEALSCGLPFLAGRIGDHNYLVNASQAGLLFEPENADDIAEKVLMFINFPPEEKVRMGKNAREFAQQELSLDKMAGKYINLFRSYS